MLFSLGIGLLCFEFTVYTWILIAIFYTMGYGERVYLSYTANLRDEVLGDSFALTYLDEHHLLKLAKIGVVTGYV